ncbi:Rap1a/Tai family immunity protein [Pseudooceanicola marinus]|uniref:Rap1a/Tai family immunity protein n=1 Tax=Pseudooceanicola marinus TaxID=396013 RepID=UPI001CD548A4|nr:Rap1a/Tai family immunity protein [Pseudooceanicola marinus]MCA1338092.1 hypothetical protein [Pseudooceanicola marinus]
MSTRSVGACQSRRGIGLAAILALAFAWYPHPSKAQQVSGNSLYSACRSESGVELGFCVGFVLGAIEGESFGAFIVIQRLMPGQTTDESNSAINAFLAHCIPSDATNEQLRDIVVRYLSDHPESRHFPARGLIWNALMEAFPCS